MLWYYAPALLLLLHSAYCFPRGKSTEKPDVPEIPNPKQRRPAHISEFTNPDTGLNPFLDLEEGRATMGRNVMEDERRDDEPYFDIDLVEGDVPDRKRIMEDPIENLDRAPTRWVGFDYKDDNDFPVLTTASSILANPSTTVKAVITKDITEVKSNVIEEVQQKDMKDDTETFVVSPSTVIYATATLAVMTVIILLVGACWWRKKLKTSRSTTTVESGEVKS